MELLAEFTDEDVGAKKGSSVEREVIWNKRVNTTPDGDIRSYYRGAARAIILNAKKEMALLHATKYDYYKLPGGGIKKGESMVNALRREILEEIGCRVGALKPVGLIIEHRNRIKVTQISYCYLAKLRGKPGEPSLEKGEKEEGFETEWWNMNKALGLIKNTNDDYYLVKFMVKRDATFIRKAMKLVSSKK